MSVKQLNEEEFKKEVLEAKEPVLVDFFANWCGPCKMLAPIMEEISETHKVFKVDTDEAGDLAMEYGIMSIPCVILFKDGKEVNRSVGLRTKEDLLKMVDE